MIKAVRPFPRLWGRSQVRGGVSMAEGGVAKALGAWPRPWGRGQGRGGMAKVLRA